MEKKFKYTDHPSIVMVANKPKLRIFEDFTIEENLPKFKVEVHKVEDCKVSETPDTNSSNDRDASDVVSKRREENVLQKMLEGVGSNYSSVNSAQWDRKRYIRNKLAEIAAERDQERRSQGQVIGESNKGGLLSKLFRKDTYSFFWKKNNKSSPTIPKVEYEYDIEEAFEKMKDSFSIATTEDLENSKRLVDAVINRLKSAGQYQKVSELEGNAFILAYEFALASAGLDKYLTEDQLISFMLKSEKGINIEFLRYYDEIMPSSVIEKKIAADKLMVFDNYAVICYDTKIEKFGKRIDEDELRRDRARRRDPILVGLIQGSRKLHYICDWTTAEDDLTLEKVEDMIGEKSHTLDAQMKKFVSDFEDSKPPDPTVDNVIPLVSDTINRITVANEVVDRSDLF